MRKIIGALRTYFSHPYVMLHRSGVALPCGRAAFYLSHRPAPGSAARSGMARTLEGRKIVLGSPMVCGSCGVKLDWIRSRDVQRRGW